MENNADSSSLYSPSRRLEAEMLVLRLGVRADLKGFDYLVDAVLLSDGGRNRICDIYDRIAAERRAKPKSVMRDISYAAYNAPNLHRALSDMVGTNIAASDVHNALVIAYLGKILNFKSRESE
ncbi:MAG: hypothetical protein J1G38_01980 [Clostridiales bacterium]|nr:hypothetical protein [Clostridiales bacterium]